MDQNIIEVSERSEVFEFVSLRDMVNQTLQQTFGEGRIINGLSSGFKDIDRAISGFKRGQLTTIAVKAGMGKTALMLSIANNVAIKNNHTVAIFSSERSSAKIANRIIESETGMSIQRLQNGPLKPSERDHMMSLVNYIAKANMFIDDSPSLSADDLKYKSAHLKKNYNIDIIIIDYLELLSVNSNDERRRADDLSQLVQVLKDIAVTHDIPVLLFSQLQAAYSSVEPQKPSLKDLPPYLSDLSDVVMFLHRCDLYDGKFQKGDNVVEMIISKHEKQRDEIIVPLRFIESLAKFTDK